MFIDFFSKHHNALMYAVIGILVVLLILSLSVFRQVRVVEVEKVIEGPPKQVLVQDQSVVLENQRLTRESGELGKKNSDLVKQVASLGQEKIDIAAADKETIAGLQAQINSLTASSLVRPDPPTTYVSWTNSQVKDLMRSLYPGTNKYLNPAFDYAIVYPISWYESLLGVIPKDVQDKGLPGSFMAWFTVRYQDIATGWVSTYTDKWCVVKIILATNETGAVNIYYLIEGKFIPANGLGDTISPSVLAVDLVK
jgi:hypothetical protein